MKAGLWIGIGVGIALTLVVVGLVVGGMLINRQVWAGVPAVTPQVGGRWGGPAGPGAGWATAGGQCRERSPLSQVLSEPRPAYRGVREWAGAADGAWALFPPPR
jgi:hypothetical protein